MDVTTAKFNPSNWRVQDAIKARVDKEALVEWAQKDNFMELPEEYPSKIQFTVASAYNFGRQIISSLIP